MLRIATWELRERLDVPWRVVLDEAVSLTRKFGATDSHRFVNAVLDRVARERGRRELHKTFGAGIKALRAEPRYVLREVPA